MRIPFSTSIAAVALLAAPALAQDTTPPVDQPVDPMVQSPVTNPPVDPTDTATPTPPVSETAPSTTMDEAEPMTDPMAEPVPAEPVTDTMDTAPETAIDAMDESAASDNGTYRTTLTPERQELFDRLTVEDQNRLSAMSEADQEQTWLSLEQQAAEQVAEGPATESTAD